MTGSNQNFCLKAQIKLRAIIWPHGKNLLLHIAIQGKLLKTELRDWFWSYWITMSVEFTTSLALFCEREKIGQETFVAYCNGDIWEDDKDAADPKPSRSSLSHPWVPSWPTPHCLSQNIQNPTPYGPDDTMQNQRRKELYPEQIAGLHSFIFLR